MEKLADANFYLRERVSFWEENAVHRKKHELVPMQNLRNRNHMGYTRLLDRRAYCGSSIFDDQAHFTRAETKD